MLVSVARLTQSELPLVPHWLGYCRRQMMPQICAPRALSACQEPSAAASRRMYTAQRAHGQPECLHDRAHGSAEP